MDTTEVCCERRWLLEDTAFIPLLASIAIGRHNISACRSNIVYRECFPDIYCSEYKNISIIDYLIPQLCEQKHNCLGRQLI